VIDRDNTSAFSPSRGQTGAESVNPQKPAAKCVSLQHWQGCCAARVALEPNSRKDERNVEEFVRMPP
jgi:hypothetical protein